MQKKLRNFTSFFCLFFLSFPLSLVFAAERKLEVNYPEIFGIKPETVAIGIPEYIKYIFILVIAIFGFIVFGALIRAGFLYLTSIDQPAKRQEAKDSISSAFLGLFVLLASYLIFYTINPELVVFNLPPLTEVPVTTPEAVEFKSAKTSLITAELPLGQEVEAGLWSEERIKNIGDLATSTEIFFTQEITVAGQKQNKISDLNKYLRNLTLECKCENLKGQCSSPSAYISAALPMGCSGDPCKKNQSKPEVRNQIEDVIKIDNEKIKTLLEYQKKFINQKDLLAQELNTFNDLEEQIISCQPQGLMIRNDYLASFDFFEKQGWNLKSIIQKDFPYNRQDPLTFYCPAGGTFYDFSYTPASELPTGISLPEELPEETKGETRISCPVEYPVGEVLDNARELAIETTIKLEKTANLLEKMAAAIKEMVENVSKCNKEPCKINCACLPNPCWNVCDPFGICLPYCRARCLQAVGGCSGTPCPREKIKEKQDEIYNLEKEIFNTLKEIKNLLSSASSVIGDKEDPKSLINVREKIKPCFGPEVSEETGTMTSPYALFSCEDAIGNFGPTGQIIGGCHARDFFCCLFRKRRQPLLRLEPFTLVPIILLLIDINLW